MKKITKSEKKQILGGAAKSKTSTYNTRLHNFSLITLSTIPGIISLGEEIYSLFVNNRNYSKRISSNSSSYYQKELSNNRRDFYAYASESFRPMIRFSPYPSKSGITFGMPWMV